MFETNKLKQLFNKVHEKFLKAIDHMECHPTLRKEKKGTSYRLHRCSAKDRDASMAHQMRYQSPDDIEMLRQGNEIIQKRYLKLNNTKHRTKIFDLATWILVWGIYKNACYIMSIKKNIQNLYDQNVLQEKQIIELTHYLNVTYGHVCTNRLVINELNIQVAHFKQNNDGSNWRDKDYQIYCSCIKWHENDPCTAIFRINEFTREC